MQHYDDMPKIPTITAEEAMKLSWLASYYHIEFTC